jgi:hypothetical protein
MNLPDHTPVPNMAERAIQIAVIPLLNDLDVHIKDIDIPLIGGMLRSKFPVNLKPRHSFGQDG